MWAVQLDSAWSVVYVTWLTGVLVIVCGAYDADLWEVPQKKSCPQTYILSCIHTELWFDAVIAVKHGELDVLYRLHPLICGDETCVCCYMVLLDVCGEYQVDLLCMCFCSSKCFLLQYKGTSILKVCEQAKCIYKVVRRCVSLKYSNKIAMQKVVV